MVGTLRLNAVVGPLAGREFTVPSAGSCLIGRARDCDLTLPEGGVGRTASRHHCRVEWTPVGVLVRDMGSRNGSFVNGCSIGRRPAGRSAPDWPSVGAGRLLADGDEVRVGGSVFRVAITAGARAGDVAGAVC